MSELLFIIKKVDWVKLSLTDENLERKNQQILELLINTQSSP